MLSSPRHRRLTETVKMKTVFAIAGRLPFGQLFQYRPNYNSVLRLRVVPSAWPGEPLSGRTPSRDPAGLASPPALVELSKNFKNLKN